jgi:uncharacterized cofD-like protein
MVEAADKELDVIGSPIPTTLESAHLMARLESGKVIYGETDIDVPKETEGRFERIEELWLVSQHGTGKTQANPKFIEAIKRAKVIVLCPGDFYSSILAALLPEGIMEALCNTEAKVSFISPLMTKFGETYRYTLDDLMNELKRYISKDIIDSVLMNSAHISESMRGNYALEHSEPMMVGIRSPYRDRVHFAPLIQRNIQQARHDPLLIAQAFCQMYPEHFCPKHLEEDSRKYA